MPHIRENQDQDHLRNLKLQGSMGTDEIHPWVLREPADEVDKPSSIFVKSWQSSEVPTDQKRITTL